MRPGIAIGPREHRGEGAKYRDETAEKDDLAPVLPEDVLPEAQPVGAEPDTGAIPGQERHAGAPPDPVAEIVADDGARRGRPYHSRDARSPGMAREDRSSDERRLAGHRKSRALEHDEAEHGERAPGRDEGFPV